MIVTVRKRIDDDESTHINGGSEWREERPLAEVLHGVT
jgi:hypothetical protein